MNVSTIRNIWLAGLLLVAVPYTVMAFDMEWRTEAGRIGPGFFPRVVGVGLVCAILLALARSVREQRGANDGHAAGGEYRRTLLLIIGATVLFLVLLEPLGALVAAVGYMLAVLAALNPRRWVLNATVAVALPVGLYLLLQTWLNAGLPRGVLGGF